MRLLLGILMLFFIIFALFITMSAHAGPTLEARLENLKGLHQKTFEVRQAALKQAEKARDLILQLQGAMELAQALIDQRDAEKAVVEIAEELPFYEKGALEYEGTELGVTKLTPDGDPTIYREPRIISPEAGE